MTAGLSRHTWKNRRRDNTPPKLGGVAAPLRKWREATEEGADGVVPKQNLATNGFGTTPPARHFVELDGLAGTPPNLGGEFKRSPANSFTPPRLRRFRWLRAFLLMPQPPLLTRRGMVPSLRNETCFIPVWPPP